MKRVVVTAEFIVDDNVNQNVEQFARDAKENIDAVVDAAYAEGLTDVSTEVSIRTLLPEDK